MNSKDMQGNHLCLICSSKKIHYDFSLDKYRVEECAACGLMRLNPQPTDQELAAIYSAHYFLTMDEKDDSHTSALKSATANHYLRALTSYQKGPLQGRLLEIGCGQGDFLLQAMTRGLSVTGIEYSSHAAAIAEKKLGQRGLVIVGEINQLIDSKEKFDYIVFADVLEHVRNPRDFLQRVHSLLSAEGIAMMVVPSLDSFTARFMKNKWMEFKPEHLWYFSTATLKQLLYSTHFGEVKNQLAKKTLSFDYVAQHFDHYPVQPFSSVIQFIRRLLPQWIRRQPIPVVASGIMMLAKKQEIRLSKKLSVVMAVYNEEKTLRRVIERVLAKQIENLAIELIIVESHSTDGTQNIVRDYETHERVKVIWQDKPRGKGNAVRAGLEEISGDFVLIQDADDEYDMEDYNTLLEPLISGEAAFVLGARHGGKAWKMRKFNSQRLAGHIMNFGHWCFTLLINLLYGLKLKDPFTMYKVFRTDCLRGLTFECQRFDFDCELLIKLVKRGYKPIEIPVNYRSRSFKEGKKVRAFSDPWTWLRAIVKFRLQKT